jgi:DNA polymerase I-like protein with 3'-5' exonuclease and polymerase domains
MIKLITGRSEKYNESELLKNGIELSTSNEFKNWINDYRNPIQLDTETNIVKGVYGWKGYLKGKNKDFVEELDEFGSRIPCKRECYVVQIGDFEGNIQWVFDIPELKEHQLKALVLAFECRNKKLIHNALFDYTTIKWCFNYDINHLVDTYLMSCILTTGLEVGEDLPKGYHSLSGCASRYLGIDISKASQTTFNGEPLSIEQIEYAAVDVTILGKIWESLSAEISEWGLENVVILESALTRSYGDSMCENLYLNIEEWSVIMKQQEALANSLKNEFYDLMKEHFYKECLEEKFIQKDDEYKFNWGSSKMKKDLLKLVYPELPDNASKIKDYIDYFNSISNSGIDTQFLECFIQRDFEYLESFLINNYKDDLKNMGIFIPKGEILININSPEQKLRLFKFIKPDITSTDKEVINKIKHPLAYKLKEYNKASKLSTSYGENFIKALGPDGMFRILDYKQILNTGRSSMSLAQLLPGQSTYRNPFKPNNPKTGVREDGYKWVVVGADYASQEAVVAATFSNEPKLLHAIENGWDFHSTCASLMFPDQWKALGGDPEPKGKPNDPILKKLRDSSKTTSFGLFYGKSSIGLGESLNIPATTSDLIEKYPEEYKQFMLDNKEGYEKFCFEYGYKLNSKSSKHDFIKEKHKEGLFLHDITTADDLVERFYTTFPNIREFLVNSGETSVINKYIRTPDPIARIRRFPNPEYESDKASIKRAGMNLPIQGSSSNMTKYAICLIKKYIEEKGLQNKLKFCLPLHDEIRYIAREDFAEEALNIIISKMEESAEFILGNRLLKAEGEITEFWSK